MRALVCVGVVGVAEKVTEEVVMVLVKLVVGCWEEVATMVWGTMVVGRREEVAGAAMVEVAVVARATEAVLAACCPDGGTRTGGSVATTALPRGGSLERSVAAARLATGCATGAP